MRVPQQPPHLAVTEHSPSNGGATPKPTDSINTTESFLEARRRRRDAPPREAPSAAQEVARPRSRPDPEPMKPSAQPVQQSYAPPGDALDMMDLPPPGRDEGWVWDRALGLGNISRNAENLGDSDFQYLQDPRTPEN